MPKRDVEVVLSKVEKVIITVTLLDNVTGDNEQPQMLLDNQVEIMDQIGS